MGGARAYVAPPRPITSEVPGPESSQCRVQVLPSFAVTALCCGSCGNQPWVTSQGSRRPLTGAFRQSGVSRTQINRVLRRSGVNCSEVTGHWTCFFCLEFFSCQCKKQKTNKHIVLQNRLLSILSCNPHFSLTASFTEHTRGGEKEKTQQKADAEGKEKSL